MYELQYTPGCFLSLPRTLPLSVLEPSCSNVVGDVRRGFFMLLRMLTKHTQRTTISFHVQHLKLTDIAKLLVLATETKYLGFPGRSVWKGSICSGHQLLRNRTGVSRPLQCCQLGTGQGSALTAAEEGSVLRTFNDSLGQVQCTKSRWGQILRELRLVSGLICFQLCSNCSLHFSWGKSWSTLNSEREDVTLRSSVTQTHMEQHLCFFGPLFTASLQKGKHSFEHGNLTFPYFTGIHKRPKQERSSRCLLDLRECVVNAQL